MLLWTTFLIHVFKSFENILFICHGQRTFSILNRDTGFDINVDISIYPIVTIIITVRKLDGVWEFTVYQRSHVRRR